MIMKKYMYFLLAAVMFCVLTMGGCGGGHDGEIINEETGEYEQVIDDTGGRGASDQINVKTWKTANYSLNCQRVYARKIAGVNSDGSYRFTSWEAVIDATNGDHETNISSDYVEFGFEFDIYGGAFARDWPFSRPFWRYWDSQREKPRYIYVRMEGTSLYPDLYIYVNDKKVYEYTNLKSGSRYSW